MKLNDKFLELSRFTPGKDRDMRPVSFLQEI